MLESAEDLKPVWTIRLAGRVGDQDVKGITALVDRMHAEELSLLLVDAREVSFPDASIRKALGDMTANRETTGRDRTVGVAIITGSTLISGAVRAILWFIPDTDMVKVVMNVGSALDHLEDRAPGALTAQIRERIGERFAQPMVQGVAAS